MLHSINHHEFKTHVQAHPRMKAPLSSTTLITSLTGAERHIMGIPWAYHGIYWYLIFSLCLRWCLNAVAFSELNHWMSSFFVGRRNVGARWPLKGWLLPSRGPPFCENKTRNITEHMFDRINASQCPHLKILEAYTALNLFSCGWRSGPFSRKYRAKASSVINHFVIVKRDKAWHLIFQQAGHATPIDLQTNASRLRCQPVPHKREGSVPGYPAARANLPLLGTVKEIPWCPAWAGKTARAHPKRTERNF